MLYSFCKSHRYFCFFLTLCCILLLSLNTALAVEGDYTRVDSIKRIATSTKANSGTDRCYLKATPFEAGTTKGTVGKGNVIYITGKVINKYENAWYITENGYFVYSGDIDIKVKDASFKSTSIQSIAKVTSADYLYVKPYDASEKTSISKGTHVRLVSKVVNSYGNTWYKTNNGKYIYSGCISTPSSYLTINSDKYLVVSTKDASSSDPCNIKKTPFESGSTVRKVAKNSSFVIIAKLKNSSGQTWYKTSDGYFVNSNDVKIPEYVELSCSYNRATSLKKNSGSDACFIKKTPYEAGVTVRKQEKGTSFAISGAVRNKYNNLWYRTNDGYYVYSGDVEVYTSTSSSASKQTAKITKQPTSVTVNDGDKATVTITAKGDGLTYQWYAKEAGANGFKKSSATGTSYRATISSANSGRQVRCVVTDKYGNKVTSDTVTLKARAVAKITKQPTSVTVAAGTKATVKITATGDGLTYQWYAKEAGASSFKKSSATGITYRATITKANSGRQVRCVVTDKYGNKVTSKTVTLTAK